VLAIDPKHPQALYSAGAHAFQRGRLDEALQALQAARAAAPGDPVILLSIAAVHRELGNADVEGKAIEASLAADPYFLPGLLAKAALLERLGQMKAAVGVYRNALKVAPPESRWPPAQRGQLVHGQALIQRFGTELSAYLADRTGRRMAALMPSEAERWREAGAIVSGQSQPYPSICNQLYVPRLPAIPFFDRAQFGWVEAVEASTEAITEELQAALAADREEFRPYVAYAPGTPVNQWQELNHSTRWSGYMLWNNGTPVAEHLQRCPRTVQVLQQVGQADIDGMCPNAMFSALAPHTHIPPHTGDTNARLVVHLPLIVPDNCLYRVGFEQRRWNVGEVLIFDDSIEHEARNDSDELRVVLIFDIWNPLLSEGEREMVREITLARRDFDFG
jgi:aspartate beta-hydroxylase